MKIQTQAQFKQTQESMVNQLLSLVYILLALAVLIAVIGIANTLLLSVFERTHEIGLLRAVGMRRRQVKAMIRSEAVILSSSVPSSAFSSGAGWAWPSPPRSNSRAITDIVVPYGTLIIFLIIAALLGLAAASWPARRRPGWMSWPPSPPSDHPADIGRLTPGRENDPGAGGAPRS